MINAVIFFLFWGIDIRSPWRLVWIAPNGKLIMFSLSDFEISGTSWIQETSGALNIIKQTRKVMTIETFTSAPATVISGTQDRARGSHHARTTRWQNCFPETRYPTYPYLHNTRENQIPQNTATQAVETQLQNHQAALRSWHPAENSNKQEEWLGVNWLKLFCHRYFTSRSIIICSYHRS